MFGEGKTTGLTFKVQLKGTDKSGTTRRIKRTHLEYWRLLDVPVLLVSYEAPTKTLRARWVHSIGADGPDSGAETFTVHMDPDIDVAGDWPASLADDLTMLRALKRGDLPVPTPIRVINLNEGSTDDAALRHVTAAMLNASRRTPSPMRAACDDTEAAVTITVGLRRMQAALPLRLATCSLTVPVDGALASMGARELGELALMLASGATITINEGMARAWLHGVNPASRAWAIPEFTDRLLDLLAGPDCASLLLDVHAHLVEQESPAADAYAMPLLDLASTVSKNHFEAYSARIRGHINRSGDDGGRLAFNLANLHRQRNDHREALELFEIAASKQRAYLRDPLYFRFIGASHWDLQQYEQSVSAYESALSLGFDPYELLPLLADSLMYAGRYSDARRVLADWQPKGRESDKLGVLRQVMLRQLVDVLGIDSQDREGYDRAAIAARYETARDDGTLTVDTLKGLLQEADALHALPWAHLVMDQEQDADYGTAIAFAVLTFDEPFGWVAALLLSLKDGADGSVIRAVVDQARFHCQERFFDAVWETADHQEPREAATLRDLVSAAYSAEPDAFTNRIRILDPTHADLVVDSVTFPAAPRRGYIADQGGER